MTNDIAGQDRPQTPEEVPDELGKKILALALQNQGANGPKLAGVILEKKTQRYRQGYLSRMRPSRKSSRSASGSSLHRP